MKLPLAQWSNHALLIGQLHFLQQFGATRILKQALHQRTGFHFGRAGVALSIGAIEPQQTLYQFLRDTRRPRQFERRQSFWCVAMSLFKRLVGILGAAQRVISQRFTRPISRHSPVLLLHFGQSFLLASLREKNLAASQVQRRKLRIQFLSLL